MRVLFWVPYPSEGASNRYRIEAYLSHLKKNGIDYDMHPFWNSLAYSVLYKRGAYFRKVYFFLLGTVLRIFDVLQVSRYGIVVIHRESYPIGGAFFETAIDILGKPFIFDFDDAVFIPSVSKTNSFIEKFKRPHKVCSILKKSSYVIAGNRYLAEFALRYNDNVSVIPTPIDTDKYYPAPKQKAGQELVIGWIGSITTQDFLNLLKNVFLQLSQRYPYVKFKIIGGNFCVDGLSNIINKEWSLDKELEELRTFDIGIMPMPNNKWTQGKCAFKAILYMSMGIPCICSPVGMNCEVIEDGINGFFADTEGEWVSKLSLLIESPSLRERLGKAGRITVEKKYSLKVNAPKFLQLLRKAYANG